MANIKIVRFRNADTPVRKGFVHAFDSLVHDLLKHKRSGDCIEVEMDDGTVQEYRFANSGDHGSAKTSHKRLKNDEVLEIYVVPGKEQ